MTEFPMRFVTNDRFYEINVYQDMFDDWVVVCDYGSRTTRAGQRKIIALPDKQSALKRADKITNVRYRHGYERIAPIQVKTILF